MWILLDAQGNLRSSGNGEEPASFPSGWSLRNIGAVNLGDVYWDVPTQTFIPHGFAAQTAIVQGWQTSDRNLITGQTIANALADLAAYEAGTGLATNALAIAAIRRIAQILQPVIRAEVRLIRQNYPDLITNTTDV
jgi:hypothetical protein